MAVRRDFGENNAKNDVANIVDTTIIHYKCVLGMGHVFMAVI